MKTDNANETQKSEQSAKSAKSAVKKINLRLKSGYMFSLTTCIANFETIVYLCSANPHRGYVGGLSVRRVGLRHNILRRLNALSLNQEN